jgi:hypothetical protein
MRQPGCTLQNRNHRLQKWCAVPRASSCASVARGECRMLSAFPHSALRILKRWHFNQLAQHERLAGLFITVAAINDGDFAHGAALGA